MRSCRDMRDFALLVAGKTYGVALKEKEGKATEESPAERKDGLREDSTLNEEGLVARRKV